MTKRSVKPPPESPLTHAAACRYLLSRARMVAMLEGAEQGAEELADAAEQAFGEPTPE